MAICRSLNSIQQCVIYVFVLLLRFWIVWAERTWTWKNAVERSKAHYIPVLLQSLNYELCITGFFFAAYRKLIEFLCGVGHKKKSASFRQTNNTKKMLERPSTLNTCFFEFKFNLLKEERYGSRGRKKTSIHDEASNGGFAKQLTFYIWIATINISIYRYTRWCGRPQADVYTFHNN